MALLGIILLCAAAFAALMGYVVYREAALPPRGESDVVIVLGAQVLADGTPSVALERRLTLSLSIYQEKRQTVIVCGAQGSDEPAPEGEVMRDWLIARGARPEDVVAETASFNTRENLLFAKEIMEQRGLSRATVVTSDYHVARALSLCRQVGIEATGAGSESKPEYWLKNHVRETLSWAKFIVESVLWKIRG